MAISLWISGLIAIISGTVELGIAIWLVNVINGLFSFWQERAAKKATDALNNMLPTYVDVIRDGKKYRLIVKSWFRGMCLSCRQVIQSQRMPELFRQVQCKSIKVY